MAAYNLLGGHTRIELSDLNRLGGLQTASEVQFDLRFETSNLDYPGIHVLITHFGGP